MSKNFSSTPSSLWDLVSQDYEELSFHKKSGLYPANSFRYEIILEFLKKQPKGKVLDAGCGPGLMTRLLQKQGWDVTACDYSKGMIKVSKQKAAEENLPDVYHYLPLSQLSKLAKKFDFVILNGVLPYISEKEEPKVFEEIKKVLTPKGILIASHYNLYFDIFGFDKWTVEAIINYILSPAGLNTKDLASAQEKISSLLHQKHKTLDREKTMKLEDPTAYKKKLERFGFEEFDQAYYNFFYLPAKFEADQRQAVREKLERKLRRDPKGLMLARTFVSFSKTVR
ncbi:MAG TPA: class I SAM-dependent methyltransferase [Candidatus Nanoarchaeia archaeon]|nr:ubiquinone biosynthesis O-methyltransferase [uncultured archaeon]